jgi:hypothetical protein
MNLLLKIFMLVYIIKSNSPLSRMWQEIGPYATGLKTLNYFFLHSIDQTKTYKDYNILVCESLNCEMLCHRHPYYANRIEPYDWTKFKAPNRTKGETSDLHIKGIRVGTGVEHCIRTIQYIIGEVVSSDDYILDMKKDKDGKIAGYGTLSWKDNVSDMQINICKILLNSSKIYYNPDPKDAEKIVCSWHKLSTK